MSESSFKVAGDLVITREHVLGSDGMPAIKVTITRSTGKPVNELVMPLELEYDDYTPAKALTAAWLASGLFTPIAARTESLADHGLSRANFLVSVDAIEIARAYRVLTGNDITEAI